MNRIFSDDPSAGWPEIPLRSFARLDDVEPANLVDAPEAVFSFDAVDASWREFRSGGFFDLDDSQGISRRMGGYWNKLFGKESTSTVPFDEMPIFNIEVTARRADALWSTLLNLREKADWVEIRLSYNPDPFPVDVYGSIIAVPVTAGLVSVGAALQEQSALAAAFNVDHWPDSTDVEVDGFLASLTSANKLVMYDVGQGAAAGLLDSADDARLFFDLGAGSYGNAPTRPKPLRFCWRGSPSIILSHWDTDHWAGENSDHAARARTWLAPRQAALGPRHHAFASRVASAGTLLIWNAAAASTKAASLGATQTLTIVRCNGRGRNGSGIACLVENSSAQSSWLLTGDAGYAEVGLSPTFPHVGVCVPHHGADMTHLGTPPANTSPYARLLYSFGPGNKHGRTSITHPTVAAVNAHVAQSWVHGVWTTTGVALATAGGEVLATAENPPPGLSGGRHLESAAVGWSAAPSVPLPTLPCLLPGGSTGCTTAVNQA